LHVSPWKCQGSPVKSMEVQGSPSEVQGSHP
jgi:hypothetical protein